MEVLGIGPLELIFIFLLALIIFGPRDLQKTGRTIGRSLNKLVHSDTWKAFNQVSRKISTLPNTLMREANMEDLARINESVKQIPTTRQPPGAPLHPGEDTLSAEPPTSDQKLNDKIGDAQSVDDHAQNS